MSEVPKDSPEGLLARAEFLQRHGYDVAAALLADQWSVQLAQGYPQVCATPWGLRGMALLAEWSDLGGAS